jgi:hypothetical protein
LNCSFEGANSQILIIEAPLHASAEHQESRSAQEDISKCKGIGCVQSSTSDRGHNDVVSLRSYTTAERDRTKKDKARSIGVWGRASTLIAADICADELQEWFKAKNVGDVGANHDVNVAAIFWELNTCLPSLGEEALMSHYCNKCVRRALIPSQSQYKFIFKSLCNSAAKMK